MMNMLNVFTGGGGEEADNEDVEHQSGMSRLCNSIIMAICVAPALMIASMVLLGWNEKRAVCEAKAIFAGKEKASEVGCSSAAQGSGELVMFSCDIDSSSLPQLSPPNGGDFFNISARSTGLATSSLMYQCKETKTSTSTKDKTGGGGKTTTVTYSYSKDWMSSAVDSGSFSKKASQNFRDNCGTENPSWPLQLPKSGTVYADKAKVGPYTILQNLVRDIPVQTPIADRPAPAGWKKEGAGYTSSKWAVGPNTTTPRIGDVRVTFKGYDSSKPTMTVLGANVNGQILPWTAPSSWLCSGFTLQTLKPGSLSKDQLFKHLETSSKGVTWILRILGFVLFWVAFCLVAGPLEVVADCIPCIGPWLGDSIATITSCISCLPACACTLFIAGIVWVAMRPLVGGPLLAAFFCTFLGFAAFKVYARQQKGAEPGEGEAVTYGKESMESE